MAREHNPDIVLWMDLEMTGLDPEVHRIVELACIVTNWQFQELATYHSVVKQPKSVLKRMDPWCVQQHGSSGLLAQVASGKQPIDVESELLELVRSHSDSELPIILAGSSIHFDRRYIRRELPALETKLHYRMLDVSSWKVVMRSTFGRTFNKPEAHRALDDTRGSIEELQYYLTLLRTGKLQ